MDTAPSFHRAPCNNLMMPEKHFLEYCSTFLTVLGFFSKYAENNSVLVAVMVVVVAVFAVAVMVSAVVVVAVLAFYK